MSYLVDSAHSVGRNGHGKHRLQKRINKLVASSSGLKQMKWILTIILFYRTILIFIVNEQNVLSISQNRSSTVFTPWMLLVLLLANRN